MKSFNRLKGTKEEVNRIRRKIYKKRIKNDLDFYNRTTISKRISSAIINCSVSKNVEEILGCSIKECREYFESLFEIGMTWGNYGAKGWHIDHIIPKSSFKLLDEDNIRKCFHYTNLQPLWWFDNVWKSNRCVDIVEHPDILRL